MVPGPSFQSSVGERIWTPFLAVCVRPVGTSNRRVVIGNWKRQRPHSEVTVNCEVVLSNFSELSTRLRSPGAPPSFLLSLSTAASQPASACPTNLCVLNEMFLSLLL